MSDETSQSRGCNPVADPESGVLADDSDAAPKMPEEFHKIVKDFIGDITNTFPEYAPIINKWWKPKAGDDIEDIDAMEAALKADTAAKLDAVFQHCLIVFPERFFDILYKNVDMFKKESEINTEFLPGISFKYLWQCDISDSTRETIWKYLQLILISIIGCVKNRDAFGDTAKLFQSINEDEFKGKLEETLENMQKMFEATQNNGQDDSSTDAGAKSGINMENMPSADDIQSHITGMLDGKLGNLAREIAEETAGNLDINMDNAKDVNDIFQNLFKNPGKLMGLVKNVGDKLDSRIKSGEIKESELLAEASEIMNKMKNMPGMGNIQSMLSKMGMNMPGAGVGADGADGAAGLGRNVKVDTNATEALLNRNIKAAETRERLKKKMEMKHLAAALAAEQQKQQLQKQQQPNANTLTDEQLFSVFSTGDKVERTPRSAVNPNTATAIATSTAKSSTSDKKKKKNKK